MDPDTAYANAEFIPGSAEYPARWAAAAAEFRATARADLGLSYGPSPRQAYDLFHPEGESRGLVVFVHGGYWRRFDRSYWSHLAAGPLARGWTVSMPSYDLCPEVRISDITRQIRQMVETVSRTVEGPIRLVGHSAGGHLVARVLCQDVGLRVRDRVERAVPISPLSDLEPLRGTSMNADLRLDACEAFAESPIRINRPPITVSVWVGGDERPAFLDQARWLSEAWDARLVVEPGKHHFDVIDGLTAAGSPLCRALLD